MQLTINGDRYEVDAAVGRSLATVLREDLGLTGTKIACNEGHCGACTVLVDDDPLPGVAAFDLLLGSDQSRHVAIASSIFG